MHHNNNPKSSYNAFFHESVYNLRPAVADSQLKAQRYISKFTEGIKQESRSHKSTKNTLGVPAVTPPRPDDYLKRHANKKPVRLPDPHETRMYHIEHRKVIGQTKPAVQHEATLPLRNPHAVSEDWEKRNLRELDELQGKEPSMRNVVSRYGRLGERMPLSGLMPHYVWKKGYGECPKYIQRYKKQSLVKHQRSLAASKAAQMEALGAQYLWISSQERQQILDNLKHLREETMHKFLLQSFALDNQTKLRDSVLLDKALKDLERQIDIVQRHKVIVVKKSKTGQSNEDDERARNSSLF